MEYKKLFDAGNAAQLEKLKENDHKSGWNAISIDYAERRIAEEVLELFTTRDFVAARRAAADVANFAHMIILRCDKEISKEDRYDEFTPGPWIVNGWGITTNERNPEKRRHIAYVPKDYERKKENINVLAAAPDLLDALEDRYSQTRCGCGHTHCKRCEMDRESEAAIEKARGRKHEYER